MGQAKGALHRLVSMASPRGLPPASLPMSALTSSPPWVGCCLYSSRRSSCSSSSSSSSSNSSRSSSSTDGGGGLCLLAGC